MKTVVDFNNTLTDNPKFFNQLENLTIVTGTPNSRRGEIEMKLKAWGVVYKKLVMCPFDWHEAREYFEMKQWKLRTVLNLKPDVYIDDSLKELNIVKNKLPECFTMLVLANDYRVYLN